MPLYDNHCSPPLADSHQGVAFEFDATFMEGMLFVTAKPVKYWKSIPRAHSRSDFIESALGLSPLPDAMQTLLPLVLTKSLEWSYEKEWRIVRVAAEEGRSLFADLAFSPHALSRIFLGCRISTRNRRAINGWPREILHTLRFTRPANLKHGSVSNSTASARRHQLKPQRCQGENHCRRAASTGRKVF